MKNKIIMITLLVLSFISFIVIYYYLTIMTIQRYYLLGILFIIPFVIIGIIELLYFKNIIKQKLTTCLLIISVIISTIAGFNGLIFISINDLLSEVTDIKEYNRMLAFEKNDGFVNHFPEIIPIHAKNVKFYYKPQFLQGSMELQLKMLLPKEEIKDYIKDFSNNCIQILDTNNNDNLQEFGIFNVGNYVSDKNILPNFTLYLLKDKQYMDNSWNHGAVAFVAVNEVSNYILFQTEIW